MATSFVQGAFTGSSATINITFGYLDKDHVEVYLNGVLKVVGTHYVWNSDSQIQILGGNPTAGTVYLAQRQTPSQLMTEYAPGNLDSTDLNFSFLQAIYIANEANDLVATKWSAPPGLTGGTIVKGAEGYLPIFDVDGNLVLGPLATDIPAAQGYALAAMSYRDQAQGYSVSALGFRNEAEAFKNTASQKATEAAQSASNAAATVGPAIRDATNKSPIEDADRLGLWDIVGAALKYATLSQLVSSIFATSRKIANGYFLSSFRLWDASAPTKGMGFDLTAITAGQTRSLKMVDADLDLGSLGPKNQAAITPAGSAVTLNGIPSGVQRVIVKIAGLTLSANGKLILRLGTSTGIISSGYTGRSVGLQGSALSTSIATSQVELHDVVTDLVPNFGVVDLRRQAPGSNKWIFTGFMTRGSAGMCVFEGGIDLGAELSQLQVTTLAGTSTMGGADSLAIGWEF